jgi:hypothetical protein
VMDSMGDLVRLRMGTIEGWVIPTTENAPPRSEILFSGELGSGAG